MRQAFFGKDDQGMLTFIVNEQAETLRIIDIQRTRTATVAPV